MNIEFGISEEEIKDKTIKNFSQRDSEGEEWWPFLKGQAKKIVINLKVLNFIIIFLFLLISLIFLSLINLQVVRGEFYLGVAKKNQLRIEPIKAKRGIIYDRNLKPLVRNIPKFSLFVNQKRLLREEDKTEIIKKIALIINQAPEDLLSLIEKTDSNGVPLLLKEGLDYDQALIFEIEKENLPGVILKVEPGREYLAGPAFSHLMGYTGKISKEELEKEKGYSYTDEIGKTGLEGYYEKILRGQDGRQRVETDSRGREIIVAQEKEINGRGLVLTIDLERQEKLTQALERQIKNSGARKGAAVILSPQNGEILALVSYPYFDNNLFSRGISQKDLDKIINHPDKPFFFRTISGEYMPGSTIKPLLALTALEEGVIKEKTTVISRGGIWLGKEFFADWKKEGHGPTDVKKALAESVNTFFYLIGGGGESIVGLGPEKISFYLQKFGLDKKTNVDLPNEKKGFLPSPTWKKETRGEDWFIGDTYNLSIGHGDINVTPLQVAYYTALIANEGKILQPHLLKEILSSENSQISEEKKYFQTDKNSFLDFKKENFKIVKQGLRKVVTMGTAKSLNNLAIEVAGKTGTVENIRAKPHSWFTAFAPYENPSIVLTIIVENGGEGGGPAAAAAREFFTWVADKINK